MARLTDKTTATAVTLSSLVNIVNTGDTSQNSTGSSYKADLGQVANAIGGYQYYTGITVSSPQILSLNTSPVTILPTPEASQYYDYKAYVEYDYGTTGYTGLTAVRFIDVSGTSISNSSNFEVVENKVFVCVGTSVASTVGSSIRIFNSSNPTNGNGIIKIKIFYNIVNFG
jgi:hypothetical protein